MSLRGGELGGGVAGSKRKASNKNKVTRTIKGPRTDTKLTPSGYMAEIRRTTEERLAQTREIYPPKIVELLDIGTTSHQKDTALDVDQALFQPFPSEVVFQQFEPHHTYEFPLALRNNDKVARQIKVTHEESPYFNVVCQRGEGTKVAPGMETTYHLIFTPDEKKDYDLQLVCVTEREKFVIPVRAIGARALLDFPDEVHFSTAPVKYTSTKTVLVRNVGDREAKFSLETQSPFTVNPTNATLAVNACIQVHVDFVPQKVGDHDGELVIHYDTGEDVYTQLYGSASDVNVRLDRSSIILENTYIGLSTQRSVTIHNRSDVVVHYQWKAFASEGEEDMQREIRSQQLAEEELLSKEAFFEHSMHNPSIRDRLPILTRSLDINRKRYLDDENFLYSDDVILVDPVEGDIWPNSQAEIAIIFQPEEATSYSRVAYCDVTGRESRLPLRVKGEGLGPRLQFSFDTLDIQNVFVNSSHAYEVLLENRGDIEASYSVVSPGTLFGPKFIFAPSSGVLRPGGIQAIQISFCSPVLGDFCEEFQWKVGGAPHPLKMKIQGVVIGPTFQFDVPQIKLGTISYGFLSTCEVTLINTSEIPMTYQLRVPGDKTTPGRSTDSGKGKEFEVKPHKGTIPPNFHQTVKINFTPAYVKSYSTALVVDVAEAGKDVFSLPITAKSVVPPITLLTPLLDFGRCFIHHPYVQNVSLLNGSNLPVKYEMPPQVDQTALVYSTTHPKGVIAPHSTLDIPLQIEVQLQAEVTLVALFDVLGSVEPPVEVGIYCIGEGPVISVVPDELSWGMCPVLKPLSKSVTLSNESLIPAEFECTLAREKTIFTVEPISAVIPPEQQLELTVTALIDDCLKFTDKLTIVVSQGVSFTVSLSAEGKGTTIVSQPPLQPRVDLGPHFSRGPCQRRFTLTNRGRRVQALSWTTEGFSAAKLKKAEIERTTIDTRDVGLKHSQKTHHEVKRPLFQIIPDKCVLEPYQSQTVTLEGYSPSSQPVNERLLCHAVIGRNPHKERIMTVDVTAEFIAPLLEFSSQEITFRNYQPPGSKLTQHTQQLAVRNVSPLPVTAVLLCGYPFCMITGVTPVAQMELRLSQGEGSTITVQYDSTYCRDRHTRIEEHYLVVAYKEHPHRDQIVLKSEVHFPNVQFESTAVDFGCVLNDTEAIQYVRMTNDGPLEVHYTWSFLRRPPVRRGDPEQQDEGVDMQSECESDSLEEEEEGEEEGETEGEGAEEEGEEDKREPEEESVCSSGHEEETASEATAVTPQESSEQDPTTSQDQGVAPAEEESILPDGSPADNDADVHVVLESGLPLGDSNADAAFVEETTVQGGEGEDRGAKKQKKVHPQPWELAVDPFTPISIEQVFDILPLHGVLLPGQSQQVQFTFYGHSGIATDVTAACRVEGGPTYQIRLSGEASDVQYRFSRTHIDLGKQLYDHVQSTEIVLYNSGKVDMDFCVMGVTDTKDLTPGQFSVTPLMGCVPSLENQKLAIHYLSGTPAEFRESFMIQVAHFEPDEIVLTGEGIFPQITFNLPREIADTSLREMALANISKNMQLSSTVESSIPHPGFDQIGTNVSLVPPRELECEVERLVVGKFALEHSDKTYRGRKASRPRPSLPEFNLDFGYVVYGLVVSKLVLLTNIGHCPVSFTTAHTALERTGFSVDLGDRVRSLPGDPDYESIEFTVRFDPAAIRCPEGQVQALLPFNLVGGPMYTIKLSAEVTRPSMELSSTNLDFGTVLCGQCKIITVRLHNTLFVNCDWTAITDKPPKKIPCHIPLHVRKKMKEKPPPKYFELDPPSGILLPGQTMDIRVKFMPSEELHYIETIPFAIRQNPESNVTLHVEGCGSEPQALFDQTLVEFSPVLPFAPGSEAEVTVSNPMPYPIEIYSLEFDKQYHEEEEILRWLKEYDKQNRLYLPPVAPGGKLPQEVLVAYEKEHKSDKQLQPTDSEFPSEVHDSTALVEHQQGSQTKVSSTYVLPQQVGTYEFRTAGTPLVSTIALVSVPELSIIESLAVLSQGSLSHPDLTGIDISPVAAAIARHLGIDLSPEAALAENRKGVAIIVHGPPASVRSTQANSLGAKYNAAVLVVDDIIVDAISSASTPAGCKARECCIEALQARAEVLEAPSSLSAPPSKKQITKESLKDKDKDREIQPDSPPPCPNATQPFKVDPLEGGPFAVPDGSLLPIMLPEDLIIEMLSDRLQNTDCRRGVVFDGIESQFTSTPLVCAALILRAFHNRKHIYFVQIDMELQAIKDRLDELESEKERMVEEAAQREKEAEEEEQRRVTALLEIEEDDYEALSEEKRMEIDRKRREIWKEKREQKQKERDEREQLEKERREEEERIKQDEEKLKRKGKGKDQKKFPTMKGPAMAALAMSRMQTPKVEAAAASPPPPKQPSVVLDHVGLTTSGASMTSAGRGTDSPSKRRPTIKNQSKISGLTGAQNHVAEESLLDKNYCYYKHFLDGLKVMLEDWDRIAGVPRPKQQLLEETLPQAKTTTPSRKGKGKQKEAVQEKEQLEKQVQQDAVEESREGLGVPLIVIDGTQPTETITEEIYSKELPPIEEILEGLGKGPGGPPLPRSVSFQVYPFPLKRRKLEGTAHKRFVFIAASPDDPNAPHDKPPKTPSEPQPEEPPPPTATKPSSQLSKRAGSVRSIESSDPRKSPQKLPARKKSSLKSSSPAPPMAVPQEDSATSSDADLLSKSSGPVKLANFRWVIPPGGERKLRLLFSSQDMGLFDHTLNFEIVGTRRRYQLFCRGLCVVPTIGREPRIVFPHRKKTLRKAEIVHKRFVLSENSFMFGPLHCGKTRERYRENRYPENMETLTISNTSLTEVDVSFCFQYDHNATTFLLEPAGMSLQPGESKDLTIWAYPKSSHSFKDAVVCCVKHNPDPVVFNISCQGVEPELKVDKKALEFKKVLLHRKATTILHLHNNTLLPVSWKLSGLEQLGEEFSFSQENGIVQPKSVFAMYVHFRASKQVNYTKKAFKIEVSDVDQIMGLMHVEPIQVQAEAYDVAMDVSFPRGTEGGLDFQCIKVGDEQKLVVQLKNKGKYDIAYNFQFDTIDGTDYSKMFTVYPTHSTLYPGEKAQSINITFRAYKEVVIKDQPILKCQVIDVHTGEQGEVIANIPIRASAKAVFSKFAVSPIHDCNFGSMVVNTRKSLSFTIENKGEFEFKYALIKRPPDGAQQMIKRVSATVMAAVKWRSRSREGSARQTTQQHKSSKGKGAETSLRTEVVPGPQRLTLGMFTMFPASGTITPGQSQTISVDCTADKPGKQEEVLLVEISDRSKMDPHEVYMIRGEVLVPAINTSDMASIFEEHRVCKQLGVLGQHRFHEEGCIGVYGEEERRFMFKSVIVGQNSKARFKISNPNKISCDVQMSIKPSSPKLKSSSETFFEVEPSNKVAIPSHSHIYVTVTFKPTAMQSYSAIFEAIPDGTKGKGLTFELQGEGNLPQVAITRPNLRNAKGQLLLLFRRLLLAQSQTLPVTLQNTGTIPATVLIETTAGHHSFRVSLPGSDSDEGDEQKDPNGEDSSSQKELPRLKSKSSSGPPPLPIGLAINESREFLVTFHPHLAKKCRGELCVRIQDNQFENLPLQLVGEGYEDEVCIEGIRGQSAEPLVPAVESEAGKQLTQEIEATCENHLYFGGCMVGETRQVTFTLANHSGNSVVKFQWPSSIPGLTFAPSVGHLHPSTSKDITVTFKSSKPLSVNSERVFGKVWKITFSQPLSQIPGWDDRMKSVRWVNIPQSQLAGSAKSQLCPLAKDESYDTPVHGTTTSPARIMPTPAKRKIIETETEPPHSVVEDSSRDMELYASAVADHTQYEFPNPREVTFRDTLMYQTRAYSFPLKNTGQITFSYEWVVLDSEGSLLSPHPSHLHLDDVGSVMSEGGEVIPFTITPTQGQIAPGQEATFTLRFSPLDVRDAEYRFKCNIPHLDSSCEPLELTVHGRSQMPYCHFDLEQSDYLTRRNSDKTSSAFGASLDPSDTRVIELHSCGVGNKITKRFHVVNPTGTGYEFSWANEGGFPSTATSSPFKCITPKGFVAGGRKYEIVFEYLPKSLEIAESLWKFSIPSIPSLSSLSFLLVGHTVEPAVNLDRAYISFGSMLRSSKAKETVYLLNNEPTPYHFAFVEKTCHCEGHTAQLEVKPMNGVLQPNSKLPIDISFKATQEQEYNFNLQCNVKQKPSPLILNVKAEGFAISTDLIYTTPEGEEVKLLMDRGVNRIIDFGQVPVNERALGQLSISNNGRYNFEYKWHLSEKCQHLVSLTPMTGVVEPHDREWCELSFSPPSKMSLRGCELTLEIVNGDCVPITLRGSGMEPQVSFSFTEHNYGPCFLHRSITPPKRAKLTITNNDKKDVSVKCLFESKPYMEVQFEAKLLPPGKDTEAVIEFRPRDMVKYCEHVVFEINGLSRKIITVNGEGAPLRIELANPTQKVVNFGALRIGDKVTKTARVVNHSPIPVTFGVFIVPSSSVPELQEEGVLTVSPSGETTLNPNEKGCEISVTFSPKARVPQFSEEVTYECGGISQPLFVVTGSCHGLEITLDSNHMPFGAVVQHSQSSRRVLMHNSGDIGASFRWEHDRFPPDFSIAPVDGYISPGMEITFDIIFHPGEVNHDIRYEKLPCHIEGRRAPLYLTLTGICIEQVPQKEVLHFTTTVRNKETRHLTILNKTNSPWLLRPIIDGEHWSGPETLSVEPNQNRHYELTYQPLTMTSDAQKHPGSIFFPLPDGTGILHNLLGTAEPPKQTAHIQRDIPCKLPYTEPLAVKNWLRRPQRFRVYIEVIRPEKLDRSVSLHGLDYIDVPSLSRRNYELHFYSFKECTLFAKVKFCNEQTGEYLYYNVTFKSTPAGVIDTIELTTPVRKNISHHLIIANPLPTPATITTSTNISDISLPSNFIVGAQSEGKCMFEYLPLRVGETTGRLTLQSSDLGAYQYDLHLVATAPQPEKPVHFTTTLGGFQQQQCRFLSYARGRTEYTCKVDSSDFHVDRTLTAPHGGSSGTETTVEVTFEPSHLGDTHATLTISSPMGGDYTIPLYGHCLVPRPQGPYVIKAGSNVNIPFKNIFPQTTQFLFTVDNPAFTVRASDNLKARKLYNIQVSYDAKQADPGVTKMGKLMVTSQHSAKAAGVHGSISWIYYLKGIAHS